MLGGAIVDSEKLAGDCERVVLGAKLHGESTGGKHGRQRTHPGGYPRWCGTEEAQDTVE